MNLTQSRQDAKKKLKGDDFATLHLCARIFQAVKNSIEVKQ
jgi:hypothetical protein